MTQPLESPREDAPYESLKETISSLPNKVRPPAQKLGTSPQHLAVCVSSTVTFVSSRVVSESRACLIAHLHSITQDNASDKGHDMKGFILVMSHPLFVE